MVPEIVRAVQSRHRTEVATTSTSRGKTMVGGETVENSRTMTIGGSEIVVAAQGGNVVTAIGTAGMKIARDTRTGGETAVVIVIRIAGGTEMATAIEATTVVIGDDEIGRLTFLFGVAPADRVYYCIEVCIVSTMYGFGEIQ